MDFKDFTAGRDDDSKRLDRIVKRIFKDNPEINCHEIIRKRLVRLNREKAKSESKVKQGDLISIASFLLDNKKNQKTSSGNGNACPDQNIDVIFRNEHLLVINKPKGACVQPSENQKQSLSEIIPRMFPSENDSLSFKVGPLHRLDRNTSGLLVFSQSSIGAKWFSESMQKHLVHKIYVGIAEGSLAAPHTWTDCMEESDEKTGGFHTMKINDTETSSTKTAITHATPLSYGENHGKAVTLVQYTIETGRKHQIRCQSSYHGFPLLGDNAYGGTGKSFFLHAAKIFFPVDNPVGLPHQLACDIPEEFKKNLDFNLINWNGELII